MAVALRSLVIVQAPGRRRQPSRQGGSSRPPPGRDCRSRCRRSRSRSRTGSSRRGAFRHPVGTGKRARSTPDPPSPAPAFTTVPATLRSNRPGSEAGQELLRHRDRRGGLRERRRADPRADHDRVADRDRVAEVVACRAAHGGQLLLLVQLSETAGGLKHVRGARSASPKVRRSTGDDRVAGDSDRTTEMVAWGAVRRLQSDARRAVVQPVRRLDEDVRGPCRWNHHCAGDDRVAGHRDRPADVRLGAVRGGQLGGLRPVCPAAGSVSRIRRGRRGSNRGNRPHTCWERRRRSWCRRSRPMHRTVAR